MNSNSKTMTVEERIVQTIKSDTLMAVIGDEDALTALAKRAIDEIMFKDREVRSPYGYGTERFESPIMAAAREAATKVAEATIAKMVEGLIEKPEFQDLARRALSDSFLAALDTVARGMISGVVTITTGKARSDIGNFIRSGGRAEDL